MENDPEVLAEVEEARKDYQSGDYQTLEDYLASRRSSENIHALAIVAERQQEQPISLEEMQRRLDQHELVEIVKNKEQGCPEKLES